MTFNRMTWQVYFVHFFERNIHLNCVKNLMHIFYRPRFMISASDTYLTFNKCFIMRNVEKVGPIMISKKKKFSFFWKLLFGSFVHYYTSCITQKHLEMYRISEERGDFYFSRKLHFEDCVFRYLVVLLLLVSQMTSKKKVAG